MAYEPDVKGAIKLRTKLSKLSDKKLALMWKFYENHPAHFVNDLCMTFDPRLKGNKVIPFILFDRQREYLEFLKDAFINRDDILIEKCRDVGLSWLNAGFSVWLFLFQKNSSILWGANKMDLVDKLGDMGSLMERIDFMLRSLPKNFRHKHSRNLAKILNKDNGSQIIGAGGTSIGRGGRSSIAFVDEAAFVEQAEQVDASLSMNTDCQVWLSTPNGKNLFYRKKIGGHYKVFTFHWYQDPRKDQEWYDKQQRKLEPHIFAQEVLIDYNASTENQIINPIWINSAREIYIPATGSKKIGFDIADEGADDHAYTSVHGVVVKALKSWNEGTTTEASRKVWRYAHDNGIKFISYDSIGVGAGAKGEFKSLLQQAKLRQSTVQVKGVNVGATPSKKKFQNTDNRCVDMFANLKAQLWWELRLRFKRTHEHYTGVETYELDQLISLPSDIKGLDSELTNIKYEINEAGKIIIESKKNMKKRGIKSPNCFVSGTKVLTDKGEICIEDIKIGDLVVTPMGNFSVTHTHQNLADRVISNMGLTGTPEHKVFTMNKGWVELQMLSSLDIIDTSNWEMIKWKIMNGLYTKVKCSQFSTRVDTIAQVDTEGRTLVMSDFYTGGFGLISMGKFLNSTISTIRMVIGGITKFQTLNVSMLQSILGYTWKRDLKIRNIERKIGFNFSVLMTKLKNGITQKKVFYGTKKTAKNVGKEENIKSSLARYVDANLSRESHQHQNVAQENAQRKEQIVSKKQSTPLIVDGVVKSSHTLNYQELKKTKVAQELVASELKTMVYNITLEKHNVYYADGILVKNCADSLVLSFASDGQFNINAFS